MRSRWPLLAALLLTLLGAGAARADTVVVNPYSGLWNTTLTYQGTSIPGTVKFSALSEAAGIAQLQAMGGHLCGAPTTYYHGDYTDQPNASTTQTGTMAACIVTAGHLVGRWSGGGDTGNIDITLNPAQNGFTGSFDDDLYGITQGYNGTFSSHFPGDGCCTTTPPPPPPPPPSGNGGWAVGGGLELRPPPDWCHAKRGSARSDSQAVVVPALAIPCVLKALADPVVKENARGEAKAWLLAAYRWCTIASEITTPTIKGASVVRLAKLACVESIEAWVQLAQVIHDPPDRSFQMPPGRATPVTFARSAGGACANKLTAGQCGALNTALANYEGAVRAAQAATSYIATGVNRVSGAVKANSPSSAFFQEALAKVNEGALASDLAAVQSYGGALAKLLHADHLDFTISARQARSVLSKHPPKGLPSAAQKLFAKQLSSLTGTVSDAALRASFPASSLSSHYKSITLIDLASIVNGLARAGQLSVATGQKLVGDLGNAETACQRAAAMQQFVRDAQAGTPSNAAFLKLGAQPLLATPIPASCPSGPPSGPPPAAPSFTGNWNTSFGPMHLTQSGNTVSGTYAICNGTATITGQVTGSALDGTWTEPCDGGQGQIHFVLSADGKSFTGLWGVGTGAPTNSWNGTRTS
jgi:hypothetical protein